MDSGVTSHCAHDNGGSAVASLMVELACILVVSHFLHFLLKPLGQPVTISQILAGFLLGPSGLSRIDFIREHVFQEEAVQYYQTMSTFSRILFMFLIGLEMDVPYLLRSFRLATIVAYGSNVGCCILAACFAPFIYQQTHAHGSIFKFSLIMMILLSNTASPIVVRVAADLKLATSELGRLAISSSIVNDITCLIGVAVISTMSIQSKPVPRAHNPHHSRGGGEETHSRGIQQKLAAAILCLIVLFLAILTNRILARWLNRRNHSRKYISNLQVACILFFTTIVSIFTELIGYNSTITCFILGVFFPRDGKTTRTLLEKLSYPVHNFILPFYFGYTGFQADISHSMTFHNILLIVFVVCLSISGKIMGTIAACHYVSIPPNQGLILAFLLNVKGHVDLLIISLATATHGWPRNVHNLFLVTVVLNTVVVGPFVSYVVGKERKVMAYRHMGLERQNPDSELRMLACVHGPRHVPTLLGITAWLSGSCKAPVTPYLMHLVEITGKERSNLLYHQKEDDLSDDECFGGNDGMEINQMVDMFTSETGVHMNQITAASTLSTVYEDVCNGAEDLTISIILIPFHKYMRIDGKMECAKEGIRTINQKVLRHAPCTVGILIDKGFGAFGPTLQAMGSFDAQQQPCQMIAVLFFGGVDDREALAFASRLVMHPDVKLTLVRFLSTSTNEYINGMEMAITKDEEVLMTIQSHQSENDADQEFLASFYNRYVATGKVNYTEMTVANGADTVAVLREMKDKYSMFIVGKGGRGLSPLTVGMNDWEECPEIGAVGDLLASSDFGATSSVLVVQQHRRTKKERFEDEFMVM